MTDTEKMLNNLIRWKETYELSFELAETVGVLLDSLMDYCKKHKIPLYKEKGIWNLERKAGCISEQIAKVNSPNFQQQLRTLLKSLKLPDKEDDDENPKELPKPSVLYFLY